MINVNTKIHFKISSHIMLYPLLLVILLLLARSPPTSADSRQIDRNAFTVYQKNQPPNIHGEYNYEFQTSNGITAKAAGNLYGAVGVVQYVSLEGVPITWTYTADSDGYHPEGEHIPATPAHVVKSLEYIRTHPKMDATKVEKLR